MMVNRNQCLSHAFGPQSFEQFPHVTVNKCLDHHNKIWTTCVGNMWVSHPDKEKFTLQKAPSQHQTLEENGLLFARLQAALSTTTGICCRVAGVPTWYGRGGRWWNQLDWTGFTGMFHHFSQENSGETYHVFAKTTRKNMFEVSGNPVVERRHCRPKRFPIWLPGSLEGKLR